MRMRKAIWTIVVVVACANLLLAGEGEWRERRQRAAKEFADGILLVHARSALDIAADGFRQDSIFYYFTGLENTAGAVLAIDGRSGESWLFTPSQPEFGISGIEPEAAPGRDASIRLGIEHVVGWTELESFLQQKAGSAAKLYFVADPLTGSELPPSFGSAKRAPAWLQATQQKIPTLQPVDGTKRAFWLLAVQSPTELTSVRGAAKATVPAVMAAIRTIRPGISQRSVEAEVVNACWKAGAHGVSFWPWIMSGENAVFPRPFGSLGRYDHLNKEMRSGELVRVDVGCEWEHYGGDLGRTVPVSGHYTDEQRELWNLYVAAYRAGVKVLREGFTQDQVYDAWRAELLRQRGTVKTSLARRAIDSWAKKENVPYFQVHTMNLIAGFLEAQVRAGTTVDFEPIASIDGQGFYLEDMFLITEDGAEVLTPGVPYTAEEIEAEMGR
jgi:Xaa-Pro aminopeptidase